MRQIFPFVYDFNELSGGRTTATITQCKMFVAGGYSCAMATLVYNADLPAIVASMKKNGKIPASLPVINPYAYYAAKADGEVLFSKENDGEMRRVWNPLLLLDHYPQKRVVVKKDDAYAYEFRSKNDSIFLEEYYASNNVNIGACLFSNEGRGIFFRNKSEYYAHWLSELCSVHAPSFVLANSTGAWRVFRFLHSSTLYTGIIFHNNHYDHPYEFKSKIKDFFVNTLQKLSLYDAVIILTQQQKKHIEAQYGARNNLFVVPNTHSSIMPTTPPPAKEPYLAVAVARLTHQKNLHRLIRNFSEIHRQLPESKLEIWGSGEDFEDLKALIAEHALVGIVKLCGHTHDINSVYARAQVMLLTSRYEGLPMNCLEALAAGLPIVSLDTNYGPADIITDGEDGFIVNKDADFISRTIELLSNPDLAKRMGEAGRENVKRYSPEVVSKQWDAVFKQVKENRKNVYSNTSFSKKGWIYFSADNLNAAEAQIAHIIAVDKQALLQNNNHCLPQCDYIVENLTYDTQKKLWRFRLRGYWKVFKGKIPKKSIWFSLKPVSPEIEMQIQANAIQKKILALYAPFVKAFGGHVWHQRLLYSTIPYLSQSRHICNKVLYKILLLFNSPVQM